MSNLKLFFFVIGMCAFAVVMALTLTAIVEKREGKDD